jgi:peptidoglycan/xylan/chitin deacetylase (PgdA/CDA1 family)
MSHPSLPTLSLQEQSREIEGSVSACEALTGEPPRTFAYPYGDHEPSLEPLVKRAGFVCACLADGWFVTANSNPFALPRIFAGNWDARQLALRLGRP